MGGTETGGVKVTVACFRYALNLQCRIAGAFKVWAPAFILLETIPGFNLRCAALREWRSPVAVIPPGLRGKSH
jgi:hypothetical protein